jgi:WD40 repeat protein
VQKAAPDQRTAAYKAFISYSHAADSKLAPALRSALRRIGKPWYRPAPFRIFLDNSSLSANPGLWDAIEKALGQSEYLLLLASKHSAQSEWVERELDWWLTHRTADTILILVTEGEIVWRAGEPDFDWQQTTALSPRLRGQFHEEPLYVDLRWARTEKSLSLRHARFRDAVLQIAPPLYGKSREDLDDTDTRQYRAARRLAVIGSLALVTLLGAVTIAVRSAREQRKVADCRELAGQATGNLETRLDLALLLGVEGSLRPACVEGRSALLTALQHRPHLEGFLSGHTDTVTNVAYAPDGKIVASSSWDHTLRLWDINERRPRAPILKGMYGAAFSPDGKLLASTDGESISLSNMPAGSAAGKIAFDKRYLMSQLSFSPDGKLLAASNDPNGTVSSEVFLWDVASRRTVGLKLRAQVFAFSPDGSVLATDGEDRKSIAIRNLRTGRQLRPSLQGHTANVQTIAFSPDGKLLAAGSEDNSVLIWDLADRNPIGKALSGFRGPVNAVAFNRDGTMLACGSGDGNVTLWDVETLQIIGAPMSAGPTPVFSVAFAPDGRTILSNSDNRVVIWDVTRESPLQRAVELPDHGSSGLALSPDGRTLASINNYNEVVLSDAASGRTLQDAVGSNEAGVAFSPDGQQFASVGWKGQLELWDRASGEPVGEAEPTHFRLFSVAFSPDGRTIATGGDSVLLLWDAKTPRRPRRTIQGLKDRIWCVRFSPDGKLLAYAGNASLGLWDSKTESQIIPPIITDPNPKYLVHADVAFSPDGKLLAYRKADSGIVLWDIANRRPIGRSLAGHVGVVSSCAFSPNGKLIATGGDDSTVILWDAQTRQPLGRPFTGTGSVEGLGFRPDGKELAVLGDQRLLIWNVSEDAWRSTACRLANRNFTPGEWSKFFGSATYRLTCMGQDIASPK